MKYEISYIENAIKHNNVNELLGKHKSNYKCESHESSDDHEIPNFKRSQLETDYVISNMTNYYQSLFRNETKRISNAINNQHQNDTIAFSEYLIANYNEIKSLYNPSHLTDHTPFDLIKPPINSKHLFYSNELIRYNLQVDFVIPMINYIEKNYINYLIENSIYPAPIENLITEIKSDNMKFEKLSADMTAKNNFVIYSDINKCLYYFSYNSFTDLNSYKSHLNNVLTNYEQYLNTINHIITENIDRLNFYNRIRLNILAVMDLFHETPHVKSNKKPELSFHIRKDTLAVFKQYVVEYFIRDKKTRAMPGLSDFQDLQYNSALRALLHVESKIKILNFEIDHKPKAIGAIKMEESATDIISKLKTKLSVPQIAYFLRCLENEKDIIDINNKSDLFRKVAQSCTSTRQDNVSPDSLKNKFNMPEEKAIEFWIEKFTHFLQFAKKERDNFRS